MTVRCSSQTTFTLWSWPFLNALFFAPWLHASLRSFMRPCDAMEKRQMRWPNTIQSNLTRFYEPIRDEQRRWPSSPVIVLLILFFSSYRLWMPCVTNLALLPIFQFQNRLEWKWFHVVETVLHVRCVHHRKWDLWFNVKSEIHPADALTNHQLIQIVKMCRKSRAQTLSQRRGFVPVEQNTHGFEYRHTHTFHRNRHNSIWHL